MKPMEPWWAVTELGSSTLVDLLRRGTGAIRNSAYASNKEVDLCDDLSCNTMASYNCLPTWREIWRHNRLFGLTIFEVLWCTCSETVRCPPIGDSRLLQGPAQSLALSGRHGFLGSAPSQSLINQSTRAARQRPH